MKWWRGYGEVSEPWVRHSLESFWLQKKSLLLPLYHRHSPLLKTKETQLGSYHLIHLHHETIKTKKNTNIRKIQKENHFLYWRFGKGRKGNKNKLKNRKSKRRGHKWLKERFGVWWHTHLCKQIAVETQPGTDWRTRKVRIIFAALVCCCRVSCPKKMTAQFGALFSVFSFSLFECWKRQNCSEFDSPTNWEDPTVD